MTRWGIPVVVFPLLLAFWWFVGWRVRVERGAVHEASLARLARAFRDLQVALGVALVPIVRYVAAQLAAWNDAWETMLAAMPDSDRAEFLSLLNEGGPE